MFILARGGDTYARPRFNTGPGDQMMIPVEVDFTANFAGVDAAQRETWREEYERNVQAEGLTWLDWIEGEEELWDLFGDEEGAGLIDGTRASMLRHGAYLDSERAAIEHAAERWAPQVSGIARRQRLPPARGVAEYEEAQHPQLLIHLVATLLAERLEQGVIEDVTGRPRSEVAQHCNRLF